MKTAADDLVESYLKRLERALSDLPAHRRDEIVEEIRDHISEGLAEDRSDATIHDVLDQLGDPETIAEETRERFGIRPTKAGMLEGLAIVLLLTGGFIIPLPIRPFIVPGIGWLAGVVLMWISPVWTAREKVIGTLIVPGGLALPYFVWFLGPWGGEVCEAVEFRPGHRPGPNVGTCYSTGPEPWMMPMLVGLLVVAAIATAIYLGRRAWRPSNG